MATYWKAEKATKRIEKRVTEVDGAEVVDYKRDMSLENIPTKKAYRLDGVHLYLDILNLEEILDRESDQDLKKALRFLNLHYRAVHRVLADVGAIKVDFAGPRLHAVFAKPYDTEEGRIDRAIATAQLLVEVLKETGDDNQGIPAAKVRVGIDSGLALAVNNGRNGNREPLFLGHPANYAAKLAAGGRARGIFLSNTARHVIKIDKVADDKSVALTGPQVTAAQSRADLGISKDHVVRQWRDDLAAHPIKSFDFYRHTPPFNSLRIKNLAPAHTVRQEVASIFADIDGFTAYVARHIEEEPENVVKALHAIRAELDAVLHEDFQGRKVRFIGDCLHGILADGTAQSTDAEATVSIVTMAAGAMQSSFDLCLEKLKSDGVDVRGLGLAIGFDFGKVAVTRLGMKGDMIRCATSCAVLSSEEEQQRASSKEVAIGERAWKVANRAVQQLFGGTRKRGGFTYEMVMSNLTNDDDASANEAQKALRSSFSPVYGAVGVAPLRAYAALPRRR